MVAILKSLRIGVPFFNSLLYPFISITIKYSLYMENCLAYRDSIACLLIFPRGTDFDPMQLTRTYCGSLRGAFQSEDEATRSSSQIQSCTHASHWLFRLILMCAAKSQECRGLGTTAPDPQIFPTLRALRCDVSTGWVEMWKCCEKLNEA